MSKFLDAAYRILEAERKPLTAVEITELARERGILRTKGQTPAQTMKSKLSTDILRRPGPSTFMRTDAGLFGLRSWVDTKEYVADRYTKALLREDAVVFPASSLHSFVKGPGLWPLDPRDGLRLIQETVSMERSAAEERTDVIQLVSGFVVKWRTAFLTYRRTRRLPEARLHGEYSMIFGGHLNPDDISPLFNIFEPQHAALMERELNEELRLRSRYRLTLRGILYDDARPVSRQHLAIVFDVDLAGPDYDVGERGFLQQDKFETLAEIGARINDFENWSQLLHGLYSAEEA